MNKQRWAAAWHREGWHSRAAQAEAGRQKKTDGKANGATAGMADAVVVHAGVIKALTPPGPSDLLLLNWQACCSAATAAGGAGGKVPPAAAAAACR